MLQITQALARQLRAVLRKTFGGNKYLQSHTAVTLQGTKDGLLIHSQNANIGVEYFQAGAFDSETLALPFTALQELEGRKDVPITLEQVKTQCVQASWQDGGVPQQRQYASPELDKLPPWPESPAEFTTLASTFLTVLEEAAKTAAKESVRYAMTNIQLRGSGEIVATDGKHLLIQSGFSFPWKDDVLVPAVDVFGCRELPQDAAVNIGKTDTHVCIRVGAWAFYLPIDKDGRYPKAEMVIPNTNGSVTTWRLDPADGEFLVRTLPKLPGTDDDQRITVDLDSTVAIRASREGEERITEVVLDKSTASGPARQFVVIRHYLARAIELGFNEFLVVNDNSPIACKEPHRTFVWMTLGKEGALPAKDNALRIHSSIDQAESRAQEIRLPIKPPAKPLIVHPRRTTMPTPSTNGNGNGNGNGAVRSNGNGHPTVLPITSSEPAPNGGTLATIIKEAEALQDVSRETCRRLTRLVSSLRRHRKQTRLMSSTLASLRQLQQLPSVA